MLKLSFTLLTLGINFHLYSQSSLSGTLIEDDQGAPIEFATAALYTESDSTLIAGGISSSEGVFELTKLRPNTYYLTIQFMGFDTKTISHIEIGRGEEKNLGTIKMIPNQQLLDEIEVSGERVTTMHKVDRQVYEAEKFQSSQGGTAVDVLRNLPSVTVNANGEISARGTSGFVVLINGKPVQSDPQIILGQIPANAVKNVELITAPSAKYDPEGKAGIINIVTSQGASDGTFVQVNAKFGAPSIEDYENAEYAQRYGADFTINHIKGKWDISAGASFLRNDISGRREGDVFTIIRDTTTRFPSDGERSFDEVNYSGRFTLGYTPNAADNFSLGFYAGQRSKDRTADILYYDNHASVNENRFRTLQYFNENLRIRRGDFVLGSFDYTHSFENKSKIYASFLYEYTLLGGPTTNRNLDYPNTETVLQDEFNTNDNPLYGTRLQLDYQSKPLPIGTLDVGYQFRNLDHTGDFVYERKNNSSGAFELVPEFSSSVNLKRLIHSGYVQLSGKQGKLSYGAGVRLEYMDRELDLEDKAGTIDTTHFYDFVKPYPSANLQYEVNDDLKFKAAYSRRVQRTTTFKMNPFAEREHSETLEQGDAELLPEFIDLVELGVVKDFGENAVYATAYFRNVKNLVNRVNTIYNDTILNRIYSNVGVGESFGMEAGADLKFTERLSAFLGGNVYQYNIDGEFDGRPINSSSWIYSVNANTTYDFSESMNIQWTLNYISSRNTAQGKDSRYLSPNLTLRKTFMDGRLSTTLQWINMDMGLWSANEQRITTSRQGEFFTTTNYVYEVDVIILNVSYKFNGLKNKSRFIKSEFGANEF
ncbi:MAG: TonB-dependent receptor [Cyclobacteriaceae bacterium]